MIRRATLLAGVVVLTLLPTFARAQGTPQAEPILTDRSFITNAAWAPDGRLFFLEKDAGDVWIHTDGAVADEPFFHVPVVSSSEQGLLGLALDPNFATEPWVYLYYSDSKSGSNRVVRVRADGDRAGPVQPVIDLLGVNTGYHNGGDMTFGPDDKLYIVVGENHDADQAQDVGTLGGKVLRLNADGSVPPDNPFGADNPVYTYGHRNSFGLCFDTANGAFWETENGPSEFDEVNLLEAGKNYGWPIELGPGKKYASPVLSYEHIIVPTGCVARDGILWFGDYGGNLHRYEEATGDAVIATFPVGITDLEFTPEGDLAIVTSNAIYVQQMAQAQAAPALPGTKPPNRPLRVLLFVLVGAAVLLTLRRDRRRQAKSTPRPDA